MTSRDKAKRLMITACGLLSLCLATLVGFIVGKKSSDSSASPDQSVSLEVVQPTSASEALLDDAFRALRDGQPKKALLTFQKIQQSQPSLTGIDYLIGHAAHSAGESSIAEEAFQRSLAKKEMDEEARLALAMNHLFQGSAGAQRGSQHHHESRTNPRDLCLSSAKSPLENPVVDERYVERVSFVSASSPARKLGPRMLRDSRWKIEAGLNHEPSRTSVSSLPQQ
jgi:hypothetical protein